MVVLQSITNVFEALSSSNKRKQKSEKERDNGSWC